MQECADAEGIVGGQCNPLNDLQPVFVIILLFHCITGSGAGWIDFVADITGASI